MRARNGNIQQGAYRHGEQTKEEWKMDLVLKYDPKADILVMKLREGAIKNEKLLDSDVLLGFDEKGELVALEVWDASKRGLLKSLTDLAHEKKEIVETLLKRKYETSA